MAQIDFYIGLLLQGQTENRKPDLGYSYRSNKVSRMNRMLQSEKQSRRSYQKLEEFYNKP